MYFFLVCNEQQFILADDQDENIMTMIYFFLISVSYSSLPYLMSISRFFILLVGTPFVLIKNVFLVADDMGGTIKPVIDVEDIIFHGILESFNFYIRLTSARGQTSLL